MTRGRVLLLGSVPRVLLAVARSLGRRGIEVALALEFPAQANPRSRYARRIHILPEYGDDPEGWLAALTALARDGGFELIMPCGDWENLLCHTHRDALGALTRVAIPNALALERLTDKAACGAMARSAGIPTPASVLVEAHAATAAKLPRDFALPAYVKPRRSFELTGPGHWRTVKKASTPAELSHAVERLGRHGDLLVQEGFSGHGVGVELLMRAGGILLEFQHRRVHQPPDGGPSSYRVSMPVTPALRDAAQRLLAPLNYTGVAMVEFLVAPETGEWRFLEVNPRFWGSLPLGLAAGADFPYGLYRMMLDRPVPAPEYTSGIYCRNWSLDAGWWRRALRAPAANGWRPALRQLGTNVVTLRERSDTFALDDPLPALHETRALMARLMFGKPRHPKA